MARRLLDEVREAFRALKKRWKLLPEQIKRLMVVFGLAMAALIAMRVILIPPDFGKYGHFRPEIADQIADLPMHFAGQEVCADCHDDMVEAKYQGFHRNVSCEVCHGPAFEHAEGDDVLPEIPEGRDHCVLCHQYLASKPTGFPQIIPQEHNARKPCIKCHDPHAPKPPQTPKECSACHREISLTKHLSFHQNLDCTVCHKSDIKHKTQPRAYLPSKPKGREFCGQCHSEDAALKPKVAGFDRDEDQVIPHINMLEHEPRYLCWECHDQHNPEVQ